MFSCWIMYKCKTCNKTFADKNANGVEQYKGKLYCKECGSVLEEVISNTGLQDLLGASGLAYTSNTDNTVNSNSYNKNNSENTVISNSGNTTNIFYGNKDEQVQTKNGVIYRKDARLCKQCKEWVPNTFFDEQSGLCHDCYDSKMIQDAIALRNLGDFKEAIRLLEHTNRHGIQPELAKHVIGTCYASMNDWDKARSFFVMSRTIPESWMYLGIYYYKVLREANKSIEYYNRAKELGSKEAVAYLKQINDERMEQKFQAELERIRKEEAEKERKRKEEIAKKVAQEKIVQEKKAKLNAQLEKIEQELKRLSDLVGFQKHTLQHVKEGRLNLDSKSIEDVKVAYFTYLSQKIQKLDEKRILLQKNVLKIDNQFVRDYVDSVLTLSEMTDSSEKVIELLKLIEGYNLTEEELFRIGELYYELQKWDKVEFYSSKLKESSNSFYKQKGVTFVNIAAFHLGKGKKVGNNNQQKDNSKTDTVSEHKKTEEKKNIERWVNNRSKVIEGKSKENVHEFCRFILSTIITTLIIVSLKKNNPEVFTDIVSKIGFVCFFSIAQGMLIIEFDKITHWLKKTFIYRFFYYMIVWPLEYVASCKEISTKNINSYSLAIRIIDIFMYGISILLLFLFPNNLFLFAWLISFCFSHLFWGFSVQKNINDFRSNCFDWNTLGGYDIYKIRPGVNNLTFKEAVKFYWFAVMSLFVMQLTISLIGTLPLLFCKF